MNKIQLIYDELLKMYGPQGWWPLVNHKKTNQTESKKINGYHPKDYSYPKTKDEIFEICLGCYLTQNTSWKNVETALLSLDRIKHLSLNKIKKLSEGKFKQLIRPTGYYIQKSQYIKEFIPFFESLHGKIPTREELLNLKGVGPETADSMLLYAFKKPEIIVDAYTIRIFAVLKLIAWKNKYEEIKKLIEDNLTSNLATYQEFHALIVEHGKRYYSKKPYGEGCPLKKIVNSNK